MNDKEKFSEIFGEDIANDTHDSINFIQTSILQAFKAQKKELMRQFPHLTSNQLYVIIHKTLFEIGYCGLAISRGHDPEEKIEEAREFVIRSLPMS